MKRVLVIGPSGSGKSTVARELGGTQEIDGFMADVKGAN